MKAGIFKKLLAGAGLLVLVALVVVALVVVALVNNKSVRIDYHLARLKDVDYQLAPGKESRFHRSLRWVRWLMAGRPDSAWEDMRKKEENALIKLGYGGRRKYVLQPGESQLLGNALSAGRLKDCWMIWGEDEIDVFAAKENFPFVEEKIRAIEAKRRDGHLK